MVVKQTQLCFETLKLHYKDVAVYVAAPGSEEEIRCVFDDI